MPRETRYCRPKSQPAETLLSHLSHQFTYLSQEAWSLHLSEGHVLVNGATCRDGDYVLQQGDMLRFAPPRSLEPPVDEVNIRILYEDESLLVCAKNGNLPVAEGGRYCENTLIGVLLRQGSRAFYTADTVVVGRSRFDQMSEEMRVIREPGSTSRVSPNYSSEVEEHTQKTNGMPAVTESSASKKRLRELSSPRDTSSMSQLLSSSSPSSQQLVASSSTSAGSAFFTVQRLDKETSGVLVLCKSGSAAKCVAGQLESQTCRCSAAVEARVSASVAAFTSDVFDQILRESEKTVRKTYSAVLLGAVPIGATFVVVNSMGPVQSHPTHAQDPSHRQLQKLKMCCEPLVTSGATSQASPSVTRLDRKWGKVACSRVRVVASSEALGVSCVEVELLTGRSHQIRVHCASLGYPVLGDKLYQAVAPGKPDGCVAVSDDVYLARVRNEDNPFLLIENSAVEGRRMWCRRHLLHATELQFTHPERQPAEAMSFVASPVYFFTRDVRFDSSHDARSFQELLTEAFDTRRSRNAW
ncbi:RNA pseudouridylate synthase-like protein [Lotmaria passim]